MIPYFRTLQWMLSLLLPPHKYVSPNFYTELLGLFWTLSIILYVVDKKSHNVSETGSVSLLRWMGQDNPTQLGPLERASLNHWTNPGL
jgi:hypothetical protein